MIKPKSISIKKLTQQLHEKQNHDLERHHDKMRKNSRKSLKSKRELT